MLTCSDGRCCEAVVRGKSEISTIKSDACVALDIFTKNVTAHITFFLQQLSHLGVTLPGEEEGDVRGRLMQEQHHTNLCCSACA